MCYVTWLTDKNSFVEQCNGTTVENHIYDLIVLVESQLNNQ